MILCDHCNHCYHKDCSTQSSGMRLHNGPWFFEACKGAITMLGAADVT